MHPSRLIHLMSWRNVLGCLLLAACCHDTVYVKHSAAPKFEWGEQPYEAAIRNYEKAHAVVLSKTCRAQAQATQFDIVDQSTLTKVCGSDKVAACLYEYNPRVSSYHAAVLEDYARSYSIRTHEILHTILYCENNGEQPGTNHSDVVWEHVPSAELPLESPHKSLFSKTSISSSK